MRSAPAFQAADRRVAGGPRRTPRSTRPSATRRPATPASSATTATPPTSSSSSTSPTRRPSRTSTARGRDRTSPATGSSCCSAATRPLTRDSAEQSEQDLVRAETISLPIAAIVLILVFTSLVAAGLPLLVAGLAIPTTLALVCFVAQQAEMSDLRPERLDDARPRARDRLLAVHGQPVPRGADEGPDASARRSRSRSRPPARPSRSPGFAVADRARSGLLVFAPRPCARSASAACSRSLASLFFALTFLPAILGHARAARQRAVRRRPRRPRSGARSDGPPREAAAQPRRSRWERLAHAVMAPPRRRPRADAVPPAPRRHAVPAPRAGHPGRLRAAGRASRAARRPSRSRPTSRPARRRRSSSSPTSPGDPTTAANVRALAALRRAAWPASTASSASRARSAASRTRRPARR